jgi:hypothetical protein
MIVGWLRLMFFALIGLTVIYFFVGIYSRSVRREKLEKEWDTDPAREGEPETARTAFIEAGMDAYDSGLKKRLLWLIYIVPTVVFTVLFILVN